MFLLDTNVVSELRKAPSGRADGNVVAWASSVAVTELFVSAVTILEIEHGVLLKERADPEAGDVLRRWLEQRVLRAFEDRILPFDLDVARAAAPLHVPDPRPFRDAIIAATATVHGLAVATRNVRDFEAVAPVIDPWTVGRDELA